MENVQYDCHHVTTERTEIEWRYSVIFKRKHYYVIIRFHRMPTTVDLTGFDNNHQHLCIRIRVIDYKTEPLDGIRYSINCVVREPGSDLVLDLVRSLSFSRRSSQILVSPSGFVIIYTGINALNFNLRGPTIIETRRKYYIL